MNALAHLPVGGSVECSRPRLNGRGYQAGFVAAPIKARNRPTTGRCALTAYAGQTNLDSLRASRTSYVRMKVKLTLYVNQAAVRRGKAWARRRKVPLSRLVEEHLNRAEEPGAGERFLANWQGKFNLPAGIGAEPRAAAILAKHAR